MATSDVNQSMATLFMPEQASPPIPAAGTADACALYCDGTNLMLSVNGAAYAAISTGGGVSLNAAYLAGNTITVTDAVGAVGMNGTRVSGAILSITNTATLTGTLTGLSIDLSASGAAGSAQTINAPAITIVGAYSAVAKAKGSALVGITSRYRNASALSIQVSNKQATAGSIIQVGWDGTNYEGNVANSTLTGTTHVLTIDGQTNVTPGSQEFVAVRLLIPVSSSSATCAVSIATTQTAGNGISVTGSGTLSGDFSFLMFDGSTIVPGALSVSGMRLSIPASSSGSSKGFYVTCLATGTGAAGCDIYMSPGSAASVVGVDVHMNSSCDPNSYGCRVTSAGTGFSGFFESTYSGATAFTLFRIRNGGTANNTQTGAFHITTNQTAGIMMYCDFEGATVTTNDFVGLGLDLLSDVTYGAGNNLLVQGINVRVGQSSHASCRTIVAGGRMANSGASVGEFYLDPNVTSNANVLKLYTNANHQATALGNGQLIYGVQNAAAGRGIYIETGSFAGAFSGSTLLTVYRQGAWSGGGTETYALTEFGRTVAISASATLSSPMMNIFSAPTNTTGTLTYNAIELVVTRSVIRSSGTVNLSNSIVKILHAPTGTINSDSTVCFEIKVTPSGTHAVVGQTITMDTGATGAALSITHAGGGNANQLVFTAAADGTGAHIYGPTTGQLSIFAGLRADAGTGRSVAIYAGDGVSSTNGGGDVLLAGGDPVSTGSYGYVKAQTAFAETSSAVTYTASGTTTINVSLGNAFTATVATGITTWAFSNPPASGLYYGFTLTLTNGGLFAQTWPGSCKWPNGGVPVLTVSGIDVLFFFTIDGGTTWRGAVVQADSR